MTIQPPSSPNPDRPPANRAAGELRAAVERGASGRSHVARAFEAGGYRFRFPRVAAGLVPDVEIACINTGGGLLGGDAARLAFALGPGAAATITTPSAEKVYRAEGSAPARVETRLTLDARARAEWLPQETILFDRARLDRTLTVDMAGDASLLLAEALVFGRLAMGEVMRRGAVRDRWRVRRDGRLVYAEELAVEGDILAALDRPALGCGARATATVLLVAPEAETHLDAAREALRAVDCPGAASRWDGMLAVRLLSPSPARLRGAIVALLTAVRGRAAPRAWQ